MVLAYFNVASVILWAGGIWLVFVHQNYQLPFVVLALIEAPLHAILATVYLGMEPAFYFYLLNTVASIQLNSFIERRLRIIIGGFYVLMFVALGAVAIVTEPLHQLTENWQLLFFLFNATGVALLLPFGIGFYEWMATKAEKMIADAMALINESIQYASRIQRSVLPNPALLEKAFADHTVIWEPKDVVGGDVYLYRNCDQGHLLALVDCTGHGVPGAFMTMIVAGAFDQALLEEPDGDPAALLKRINQLVKGLLGQDGDDGESDDGLECGLCLIDDTAGQITYAGARFELWGVNGDVLTEIKGEKVGIGYRRTEMDFAFTNHVRSIEKDDRYYMTSDGLVDQVGGEKHRAHGKRRLKEVIMETGGMKMANQAKAILEAFETYQGDEVRRDDISLLGFEPIL